MNIKMAEDNLNPTNIKVVGIGGGGCNAINRMIEKGFGKVEFIALNTDVQAISGNNAQTKIQIGSQLTRGLGAGANPEVGEKAALESRDSIKEALKGANMVFIAAGMGGGTGTGASPVVAEISKELGILTIAVVTKPFVFEGTRRMKQADEGIKKLEKHVDSLIIIPNQRLVDVIEENISLVESFYRVDDILRQGIQGIADIINKPGLINVDFADVKAVMSGAGTSIMGIGVGTGKNKAQDAVERAINNPLLDLNIHGARGLLININGGKDLSLSEYTKIITEITDKSHPDAIIIAGALIDESFQDQVSVTLIATSFEKIEKIKKQQEAVDLKNLENPVQKPLTEPERKKEEKNFKNKNDFANFNKEEPFKTQGNFLFTKEEFSKLTDDDSHTSMFEDLEVPTYMRKAK